MIYEKKETLVVRKSQDINQYIINEKKGNEEYDFHHHECICNIAFKSLLYSGKLSWPLILKKRQRSFFCPLCGHTYTRNYYITKKGDLEITKAMQRMKHR